MGPEGAETHPGRGVVAGAQRATHEIDDGRRGKGYLFGAFRPATGAAFARPYGGRGTADRVDLLAQVELWRPAEAGRVDAIVDDLGRHRATDVPQFMLAHPRREMVFQPTSAASLNPIEPWWEVPRSLALRGRRFESWAEIARAVAAATASWNAHRHPFVRGHRRRYRPRRQPGIALPPKAA